MNDRENPPDEQAIEAAQRAREARRDYDTDEPAQVASAWFQWYKGSATQVP